MNDILINEKIVVAGAAGLLGANLVFSLLEQGAQVVAVDIELDFLRARLNSIGVNIEKSRISLVELDITNEIALHSFFQTQAELTGAVNTTYPRNSSYGAGFFDVSLTSFNENVAMHLGSCFLFTQQCAIYFNKHKTHFSLVNISSVYGVIAPKFDIYKDTSMTMPVEYAAIKSAILHLNKYATSFVNNSDFRVNSVSPGGIFDNQPEEFLKAYRANTHGNGMLDVKAVLDSIVFLLSRMSKYVTGQNIIVDDGFHL